MKSVKVLVSIKGEKFVDWVKKFEPPCEVCGG
jgi:hypothetical protein